MASGACCYYLEAAGGLPMRREQAVRPGDVVVSSELGYPVHFSTSGGALTPLAERDIRATLPLRLIALHTRSAYSTVDQGFLPFDISTGVIDRVRADVVVERQPKLSYLPMNAPEAEQQLVSGVYALEGTLPLDGEASRHSFEDPRRARAARKCGSRYTRKRPRAASSCWSMG